MLPEKIIDGIIYKPIGENNSFENSISDSSDIKGVYFKLKDLRKSYESKRERLLFLAEHHPGSEEYKQLRSECMSIFQAADKIDIDRS